MAYKCLTLEHRRKIEELYAADKKPQEIADVLGVTVATIYRELHRGETRDAESGPIKPKGDYLYHGKKVCRLRRDPGSGEIFLYSAPGVRRIRGGGDRPPVVPAA